MPKNLLNCDRVFHASYDLDWTLALRPTVEQLTDVLHTISQRVASFLERRGLLERDEDNSYLTLDGLDEDPMQDIHSRLRVLA